MVPSEGDRNASKEFGVSVAFPVPETGGLPAASLMCMVRFLAAKP
jgi:hypothetical protein